ncbi:MAG: ribonuclease J [Bacilli bacterium]|nr:ribonuclease J [Bacilli bacterium]
MNIKIFALGGLNEIGKNMYVVEVDDEIYVFDSGLKYADDKMLGVDYIIPNYDYLIKNKDRIQGIFLTHGHDEQMGAIPDMLLDLPCINIFGTKFTLDLLQEELNNENLKANLIEIKPHRKMTIGKNEIFPISLSHSVPDAVGYVLYTKQGAIFYTGNFVFDASLQDSYKTDIGKLAYVGKQGVLCLLSESVYADKPGYTSPNHRIHNYLKEVIDNSEDRIIINIYKGQFFRIQEILNCIDNDRKLVIMGKTLENNIYKSIENGYIKFDKSKIGSIHHLDKNSIILVCDEREKPYSNIKRIVKGYDKFITLKETDTVVFASPVYDGMEKTATVIFDDIAKLGCNLITLSGKKYPSLHASKEDLMLMLSLMNPKYYFPVIGEYRHQVANYEIAKTYGMNEENIILNLNGAVATFENGELKDNTEIIKVDDILIDGKTVGDVGELVIKDREMLGENGIVLAVAIIDKKTKKVFSSDIVTKGFVSIKDNKDLIEEAKKMTLDIIKENTKASYVDYSKVKNEIRDKIGKYFYAETECKPVILIMMQEI